MKKEFTTLTKLPILCQGTIENLNCTGTIRRRLLDLGLVTSSFITPVFSSPSKGLRAYDIRGCLIAIRDEDASSIKVSF